MLQTTLQSSEVHVSSTSQVSLLYFQLLRAVLRLLGRQSGDVPPAAGMRRENRPQWVYRCIPAMVADALVVIIHFNVNWNHAFQDHIKIYRIDRSKWSLEHLKSQSLNAIVRFVYSTPCLQTSWWSTRQRGVYDYPTRSDILYINLSIKRFPRLLLWRILNNRSNPDLLHTWANMSMPMTYLQRYQYAFFFIKLKDRES